VIDSFALALTHALLLLAAWRLVRRRDLDDDSVLPPDPAAKATPPFFKRTTPGA
jgi:hypothetical protein